MASKKSTTNKSSRKFGAGAHKKVAEEIHEAKRGQLHSGRSKKKVKSRKQAVAIGLSVARRAGARVPPPPGKSAVARSL